MNAIEINCLTKYYKKTVGIKNVSMEVSKGEIFGFIGPNGAGKSTTIRTLLNFIFPTSGSAKIFDLDIVKKTKDIKYKIGYLPAEANYYHKMTVKELMAYSAGFFGLKDWENRMNELAGMLTLDIGRKIADLSSGNKKKVSIIQALLHKPELLILDEPTSGLDPLVQSAFYEILRKENSEGMTIFFSSHILSEVQKICDRVAIIRNGTIIKVESIENLKRNLLKRVYLTFYEKAPSEIEIAGVVDLKVNNKHLNFMYDGNINELIKYLSKFNIENISIEEPDLDEIFMHFYENFGGKNVN